MRTLPKGRSFDWEKLNPPARRLIERFQMPNPL
jgi:hypothetical protein